MLLYAKPAHVARPDEKNARKSIFQDITQVIVIKQTIEHDF